MRLTVSLIPESGIEEELNIPIALNESGTRENIHVLLKASRFGEKVLLKGKAASKTSLDCSRCLKRFSFHVKFNFDFEYIPYRRLAEEDEHGLRRSELDVGFYRGDEIDITGLVRGQMLLAIPMKPLCKPDCRGMCPQCGENLNKSVCKCSTERTDTRLEPLKKIKESLRNERSKNG